MNLESVQNFEVTLITVTKSKLVQSEIICHVALKNIREVALGKYMSMYKLQDQFISENDDIL